MKINFTKKEYEVLLNALFIADWVLHAHKTEESSETQPYRDLEQKIMSLAKEFGMEKHVIWDARLKNYFHSREFEEGPVMSIIEEFEDDTFWDELIDCLSKRDFVNKYGEEAISKMDMSERFEKIGEFEEKYSEEFENSGLDNLRID